jgi:mannose-6-phosphate isomerase-like protein (cupin superfamily)
MTRDALRSLLDDPSRLAVAVRGLIPACAARAWKQIASGEHLDAWLIAWGADSEVAAHDHGGSDAAVHVLRGRLVEWYRDPRDRPTWNVRELSAGSSITVPATRVHEVHHPGSGVALSVHVYAPPLRAMNAHPPVDTIGGARRRELLQPELRA